MIWGYFFGDGKSKPSTLANPGICPNCNTRPVALNPTTGQYFDYCSKTCATQAKAPGTTQRGSLLLSLCEQCKKKPKFRDGTKVHPYCGRTCAKLAASSGSTPVSPTSPTSLRSARSTIPRTTPSGTHCQTPGCLSPVFVDANGIPSKYCKKTHREWGERGCIFCRAAPRNGTLAMCQPCYDRALHMAPVVIEVPEDHENYKSVAAQFQQSWRHNTACPQVRAVYKIVNTAANLKKYEQYRDGVEARGIFLSTGKSRGNENRRWHGTRRRCNIGDKGVTTFCTNPKCSLCCIVKTSFSLGFFKGATGWGRFGVGIYTSSTSSKSNDYSYNEGITSDWKALLLNKVVVGKGIKLTQDNTNLTQPPSGYDSVSILDRFPSGDTDQELGPCRSCPGRSSKLR
ncbi:hypothetical protein BDM02DRAFT_1355394 [Thelephora ganbajun]|uniref:Uncharacterized protein n=1 Tax=Thelephora ganbajun TaxID=370292 RepID=A0ACB6Z2I0_THEGA|nr:hypothetical protein BDM02DRAFT_1355394 [Thelephora ganbajun]